MKKILLLFLFFPFISFSQTVIDIEEVGGVYEVPCTVNGLNLKFIFDTGASNVLISKNEANFMLKYGYLKDDDIIGVEDYLLADGTIVEGLDINLKTVKIGDIVLENIKASIIDSENAPLLLGQSVIRQLGDYKFDYKSNKLIIYSGLLTECVEGNCENGEGKKIIRNNNASIFYTASGNFKNGKLEGNGTYKIEIKNNSKFYKWLNDLGTNRNETMEKYVELGFSFKKFEDLNFGVFADPINEGDGLEFELKGEFKDNKIYNGLLNLYAIEKNGKKVLAVSNSFNNGMFHGKSKSFYRSGNIKCNYEFAEDKKEGKWIYYNSDSIEIGDRKVPLQGSSFTLDYEENWKNNLKNGLVTYYTFDGEKMLEVMYKDDKKNGMSYRYYDGTLIRETEYRENIKVGKDIKYRDSKIERIYTYSSTYNLNSKISKIEFFSYEGDIRYTNRTEEFFDKNGNEGVDLLLNNNKIENKVITKDYIFNKNENKSSLDMEWVTLENLDEILCTLDGSLECEKGKKIYVGPNNMYWSYSNGKLKSTEVYDENGYFDYRKSYHENGKIRQIHTGYDNKEYNHKKDKLYYSNGVTMMEYVSLYFYDENDKGEVYHSNGNLFFKFEVIPKKIFKKLQEKAYNESGWQFYDNWHYERLDNFNRIKTNIMYHPNGEIFAILDYNDEDGLKFIKCFSANGSQRNCKRSMNIKRIIQSVNSYGNLYNLGSSTF